MKQMFKPRVAIVFVCILQNMAWATTYYVDSMQGNDENQGTHAHEAWQTLDKVNATTFLPGDEIRFRANSIWFGGLKPKGSGSKGHPIIVDKYGNGERPVLNGEGRVTNVVHLHNQPFWEIRNFEITNYLQGDTKLKRGVYVGATDYGTLRHIHLVNLIIHDINGDLNTKDNGGIFYEITGHSTPTRFDDFLIEGCHIYDIDRTGISNQSSWQTRTLTTNTNWYPSTNVVIRDNVIERAGNNGLIVRVCKGAVIEHNVFKECSLKGSGNAMFPFNCDNTLVQYNEACYTVRNPGDVDAGGFDSDYRCKNSIFQYNYSHDNDHGFMLVCCQGGSTRFNDGTIVRYNISVNDGGNVFRISGQTTNTHIYNNTIYLGSSMSTRVIWHKSWQAWPDSTRYDNNIFYTLGTGNYDFGSSTDNVFSHNLFYGNHPSTEPSDPYKSTTNPRFVDPDSRGMLFNTGAGFQLQANSPCIDSGQTIPDNGALDFWGNPVSYGNTATDRGAHEYTE